MLDDFVVTAHALERFEERFPELWTTDEEAAHLIHGEVMDAFDHFRASHIAPIELALHDLDRWQAGKGVYVWTRAKDRGYVIIDTEEGAVVATVLVGKTTDQARRMLYGDEKVQRRENLDSEDRKDAA